MILLILFLGLVLRLIAINQSLWLDEAIGALAVKNYSWHQLFSNFLVVDNHPPLYYAFLKIWTGVFGYSEMSLRMPSVFFALITIYFIYKIALIIEKNRKDGSKTFNKIGKFTFPEITALFLSVSQFDIYFSQEARMYSMDALFATLLIYFFIKLYREGISALNISGFSLAVLFLGTSDYVTYFLIISVMVYAFIKKFNWKWFLYLCLSFVPLLIFWTFWINVFLKQSQGGAWLMAVLPSWKNLAGGATLKQVALVWIKFVLGRVSFINKYIYALLLMVSSIPVFLALISAIKNKMNTIIIWVWVLAPLVLSFLTSFTVPSFIYFRFLYIYPAFILLLAWGIANIKRCVYRTFLFCLIVFFFISSSIYYYFDDSQQRENWRGAVSFVESSVKENEVVIFEYPQPFAPYRWYETKPEISVGVTNSISANPEETKNLVLAAISNRSGLYYFDYLHDLSDPQNTVRTTLNTEGFKVDAVYNFNGLGQVYYYTREHI